MKHVLLITSFPSSGYGGVVNQIKNLVASLNGNNDLFVDSFYMPKVLDRWLILGCMFVFNRFYNGFGTLLGIWLRQLIMGYLLLMQHKKYDLLHFQDPFIVPLMNRYKALKRDQDSKIILSNYALGSVTDEALFYKGLSNTLVQTDPIWRKINRWESEAYKTAKIIITDSKVSADLLVQHFGFDHKKIRIVYPGIDHEKYHQISEEEKSLKRINYGFDSEDVVITTIAALNRMKGYCTLLNAISLLNNSSRRYKFVIIGKGPMKYSLESRAKELNIQKRVTFCGYVEDPKEILTISDIFILPSHKESTSLAMVEAALSGVPILATSVGGAHELFKHMESAYLVDPNNPYQIREGIEWMLSNYSRRRDIASKAYEIVSNNCIISVMAKNYSDIYLNAETILPYNNLRFT